MEEDFSNFYFPILISECPDDEGNSEAAQIPLNSLPVLPHGQITWSTKVAPISSKIFYSFLFLLLLLLLLSFSPFLSLPLVTMLSVMVLQHRRAHLQPLYLCSSSNFWLNNLINWCFTCEEWLCSIDNWSLVFWMELFSMWTQEISFSKIVPNEENCVKCFGKVINKTEICVKTSEMCEYSFEEILSFILHMNSKFSSLGSENQFHCLNNWENLFY